VRTHDFGPQPNLALGFIAVAAGAAGVFGTIMGARVRNRAPLAMLVSSIIVATAMTYVAGIFFTLATVILVAIGAGIAQTVGKLSLDATIQRDVEEHVRTAAFARSETVLQLAFVVGGAFGLLPLDGRIGLMGVGVFLTLVLFDAMRRRARHDRA
jgi:predicted MFS family arabinose efflux permease